MVRGIYKTNPKPPRYPDPTIYIKVEPEKGIYPVTRGRLRNMLRYFTGKKVYWRYEYNNSMGGHAVRDYTGILESFEVNTQGEIKQDWQEHVVTANFKGNVSMSESFTNYAEFYGLGKIREYNSGPYCFFTLKKV